MTPAIVAVCRARGHDFSKRTELSIRLLAGLGVEGDAHLGETVQHLHQIRTKPGAPNLRQVHLIHEELFAELRDAGFSLGPGDLGENVTTRGIDLLALPRGARLRLGDTAIVEVTGLRNPCAQIDRYRAGLKEAVLGRDATGAVALRKTGVMAIVIAGGDARPGDAIIVEMPAGARVPLAVV